MTKNDNAALGSGDSDSDATPEKVKRAKKQKVYAVEPSRHPYTPLGYDHGTFYYLSHAARQVIALSTSAHTINNLLQLASLDYWEAMYPNGGKVPVDKAANYLFAKCYAKGIYDPAAIRGRGAWWDEGRSVMHAGDRLLVDGKWIEIPQFKTKYLYEAGKSIQVDADNPLTVTEALRFGEFMSHLTWQEPKAARLAAGWCVCALIAGALQWHPHLFVVAKAGSGKSWLMEKVISEILFGFAQEFKSSVTTEPGIRRSLSGSSLPVMLDDPDGTNPAQMQKIIELMRACSQSGRAKATQGGGDNGGSVQFELLSCFVCAAINNPVTNEADTGRITLITLDSSKMTQQQREDHFAKLQMERETLLTPEYCSRFQARAIHSIRLIRESVRPFSIAASRAMSSTRAGDQIGTILAGAWSLRSDTPPTLEQAIAWVRDLYPTEDAKPQAEADELICMRTIAQSVLQMDHGIRRRVDELVRAAIAQAPPDGIALTNEEQEAETYRRAATATLRRHGILPQAPDSVAISNSDEAIRRMLRGTAWEKNWANSLMRISGAQKTAPLWFGRQGAGQTKPRCVALPLAIFLGESEREPGED